MKVTKINGCIHKGLVVQTLLYVNLNDDARSFTHLCCTLYVSFNSVIRHATILRFLLSTLQYFLLILFSQFLTSVHQIVIFVIFFLPCLISLYAQKGWYILYLFLYFGHMPIL